MRFIDDEDIEVGNGVPRFKIGQRLRNVGFEPIDEINIKRKKSGKIKIQYKIQDKWYKEKEL